MSRLETVSDSGQCVVDKGTGEFEDMVSSLKKCKENLKKCKRDAEKEITNSVMENFVYKDKYSFWRQMKMKNGKEKK